MSDEKREAAIELLFPAAQWSEYARGQCRAGWTACEAEQATELAQLRAVVERVRNALNNANGDGRKLAKIRAALASAPVQDAEAMQAGETIDSYCERTQPDDAAPSWADAHGACAKCGKVTHLQTLTTQEDGNHPYRVCALGCPCERCGGGVAPYPPPAPPRAAECTAEERAVLQQWTREHGKALVPHGVWHDSFGDGMRAAKKQVAGILARRAAKKGTGQ